MSLSASKGLFIKNNKQLYCINGTCALNAWALQNRVDLDGSIILSAVKLILKVISMKLFPCVSIILFFENLLSYLWLQCIVYSDFQSTYFIIHCWFVLLHFSGNKSPGVCLFVCLFVCFVFYIIFDVTDMWWTLLCKCSRKCNENITKKKKKLYGVTLSILIELEQSLKLF